MRIESHKSSFYRESGWLMVATVVGGSMMWAVHFLSKAIPAGEYGDFGAFLAVVMVLPAIPLQMVFAQQTAKALAENEPGQVSGLLRAVMIATILLWGIAATIALILQGSILGQWKISNPAALWFTIPVVLFSLVLPMFWGILQGAQNFLWLGWSLVLNSLGRLVMAAFVVLVIGAYASGMLFGVLFGLLVGLAIAMFQTREFWTARPAPFDWKILASQVCPLMLGFIGFQILFTADTMFVKAFFPEDQAGYYVGAGTLSRALMWLVLPLASVMFPKLVRSAVRAQKSSLGALVLLGTAVLSCGGAIGLTIFGPFVIRLVYKANYVEVAASLLPWYASVMIPLALANVLLNQLMAKPASRWGLSICIVGLAAGYMMALGHFHQSLITVLKVMGVSNTVFLLLCGFFVWLDKRRGQRGKAASATAIL